MFRMNGTPRAQGSAGAARFSFAQGLMKGGRLVSVLHGVSLKLKCPAPTAVPLNLSSGEPGWVLTVRTRCEHVHVRSVATSMSLTVLTVNTHPSSGRVDGITF